MASDSEREDLVQAAKAEQQVSQAAKPRVRRAPRPEGAPAPLDAKPEASEADHAGVGEPKKRRRRRRKPGEAGDSAADSGTMG
jgi:poly(A) polymerase